MIIEATIFCLALNIFHEARGEPEQGRIEVALVTMNRAQASGKTVCQTIKAPNQFSWVSKRGVRAPLHEPSTWKRSLQEAQLVYNHLHKMDTRNSMFFHNKYVRPAWVKHKKKTISIGNHVFYTYRKS